MDAENADDTNHTTDIDHDEKTNKSMDIPNSDSMSYITNQNFYDENIILYTCSL